MLDDKIALITGGCRGIGKAVALEFAKAGATVILNDVSSEDSAQEVLKEIEDLGGKSEFLQFNVTESGIVEEKIKYILLNIILRTQFTSLLCFLIPLYHLEI